MERTELADIWQAFCVLSDAQESIESPATVLHLVNHAKLHLARVMGDHLHDADLADLLSPCTLETERMTHERE